MVPNISEVQAQHISHMQAVAAATGSLHQVIYPQPPSQQPITDAQVAQARLHKQGHRPLGRTQSAPLPLGHPMLTGSTILIAQTHYENSEAERQAYEQQTLKQKLRQTALSRSNTREQLKEEEPGEV